MFIDTSSGSLPIPFSFHSSSFYLPLLFLPLFLLSSTTHPTSQPASQPLFHQSVHSSCHPSIHPSMCPSTYSSIYPSCFPSSHLSIHPAFFLSLHPSSHLSISLILIVWYKPEIPLPSFSLLPFPLFLPPSFMPSFISTYIPPSACWLLDSTLSPGHTRAPALEELQTWWGRDRQRIVGWQWSVLHMLHRVASIPGMKSRLRKKTVPLTPLAVKSGSSKTAGRVGRAGRSTP